jgi:sialate O-acetylesterase
VVVSADTIPAPVAVRFAWSQEAQPNLMNSARLPAAPFRSDDWPLR